MKQLLAIAFILNACCCLAQNAIIKGRVVTAKGDALISACVVIDAAKGWAAVTDYNGNYEIRVPAGKHRVSYRYKGKNELIQEVAAIEGDTIVVNALLNNKGMKGKAEVNAPDFNVRILTQLNEMRAQIKLLQAAIQQLLESNKAVKN
ncbi:MAG: carboxypeptidase regulatory-like domain-containing protein [Chitinophagales bacterium]|nr:carboxypeptidase regulatory-like domain-containing protein [Chitinophagales bacterium]